MKYARVNGTDVCEVCTPIDGFTIDQCFHPDIVARLIACDDEVTPDWTFVDGVFVAPVVETPEEPAP